MIEVPQFWAKCHSCGWTYEDTSEILLRCRVTQLHTVFSPIPCADDSAVEITGTVPIERKTEQARLF